MLFTFTYLLLCVKKIFMPACHKKIFAPFLKVLTTSCASMPVITETVIGNAAGTTFCIRRPRSGCSPPSSLPLFDQNYSAHSTADYHISNVIASDILKNVGINVVYETGIHVGNILDLVLCVLQKSK